MSAPTLPETTARDQRLARALEQLVEMRGYVGLQDPDFGAVVTAMHPAGFWSWCRARQDAWAVANPPVYASPGDPEDLARAIGEAHANWTRSNEQ